jgi:hypothetical protein
MSCLPTDTSALLRSLAPLISGSELDQITRLTARTRQDSGGCSGPFDQGVTVLARGAPNRTLQLVVQIPRLVRELLNRRLGPQGIVGRPARV